VAFLLSRNTKVEIYFAKFCIIYFAKFRGISQNISRNFANPYHYLKNRQHKITFSFKETFYRYYDLILNQVPIISNQIMVGSGVGANSESGTVPYPQLVPEQELVPDPEPESLFSFRGSGSFRSQFRIQSLFRIRSLFLIREPVPDQEPNLELLPTPDNS
jgi:hypothetical protein